MSCNADVDLEQGQSAVTYLTEIVPLPVNIMLLLFIIPLCFYSLNLICEELLVPALNVMVGKLRLSDETANSTMLAAGASLPQFFSSIISLFITYTNIGIGLTIGSSFFNSLCILSAVLLNTKSGVVYIRDRIFLRDMFFYITSLVLLIVTLKGSFIDAFIGTPAQQEDDCLKINLLHTILLLSSWLIYASVCGNFKTLVSWFCPSKYGEDGDDCDYHLPPMQMDDHVNDENNEGNISSSSCKGNFKSTLSWRWANMFTNTTSSSDEYADQLRISLVDAPVLVLPGTGGSENLMAVEEVEDKPAGSASRREKQLTRTASSSSSTSFSNFSPPNPDDIVRDLPDGYSCYIYKKNKFYSRFVGSHRAFDRKWFTCDKIEYSFRYARSHEKPSLKVREFFIDGNEKIEITDESNCIFKISHTMKSFKSMEFKAQNAVDFHKICSILNQKIKDAALFSELNGKKEEGNVYIAGVQRVKSEEDSNDIAVRKTPRLLRIPDTVCDEKGFMYYLHGYVLYPWKFLIYLTTIDIRMIKKKNMSPYERHRKASTTTSSISVEMNSLSYAGDDEDEQDEIHEGSHNYMLLSLSLLLSTSWIFFICYSINVAGGVFANCVGVSSGVMGLTVVAFGTSLPNLISAINLSRQGLGGLVITNVISSSILSVFVGLSLPWLLIILLRNHGAPYDEMRDDGIVFAVIILVALCIAFVMLCIWTKFVLKRYMASFFICCYCLYCAYGIFSRAIYNI